MMFVERRNNFVDYEFNVQGPTSVAARESGDRDPVKSSYGKVLLGATSLYS